MEFNKMEQDLLRYRLAKLEVQRSNCANDRPIVERLMDDSLRQVTDAAMFEKLAAAREKGRGGWWNPEECPIEYLRQLLDEHVAKGDMRDIINLAAMIYWRELEESLTSPATEKVL